MSTIVRDLPPEEDYPPVESSMQGDGQKVFAPSVEDDEALARRLQAEWDANDAAASADLAPPVPTTADPGFVNLPPNQYQFQTAGTGPAPSPADDEALARQLQAEWDANDAAASESLAPSSVQTTINREPNLSVAGSSMPAHSVATVSNAWGYDVEQSRCTSCNGEFNPFNRRHHCRLCGKIFCNKCSDQKALIPPSSIVLTPSKGGKKAQPPSMQEESSVSFSPDPDPDRMLTYLDENKELLYGKGLEERFQLAREPLRVCVGCHQSLQPLQEELRTTNSNAMRFNHIDPTDPRRFFNSPLAFTLGHEVRKAAYALNNMLPLPKRIGSTIGVNDHSNIDTFVTGEELDMQQCKDECASITPNFSNLDGVRIPARLLEEAKGVAVLTVAKGGFGLAGMEFGTGLVVARLGDNQQWSAPCAIGTAGMSWGALIGAQVSDHVFLLMTDSAVELMFNNDGNLQLGADVGVAVGPVGRALEADFAASSDGFAPIYTYSLSKGMYAGISLDGKVVVTRNNVNEKFYGRKVTGQEILNGEIPSPPAARPLYDALQRCHVYARNDAGGSSGGSSMAAILNRPRTHVMHGYPELPPNASMDPFSRQQQQYPRGQTSELDYGGSLMPPAANDQHSYAGQSYATGFSDMTSDPGY